jgi:hypothetical protein
MQEDLLLSSLGGRVWGSRPLWFSIISVVLHQHTISQNMRHSSLTGTTTSSSLLQLIGKFNSRPSFPTESQVYAGTQHTVPKLSQFALCILWLSQQ